MDIIVRRKITSEDVEAVVAAWNAYMCMATREDSYANWNDPSFQFVQDARNAVIRRVVGDELYDAVLDALCDSCSFTYSGEVGPLIRDVAFDQTESLKYHVEAITPGYEVYRNKGETDPDFNTAAEAWKYLLRYRQYQTEDVWDDTCTALSGAAGDKPWKWHMESDGTGTIRGPIPGREDEGNLCEYIVWRNT